MMQAETTAAPSKFLPPISAISEAAREIGLGLSIRVIWIAVPGVPKVTRVL